LNQPSSGITVLDQLKGSPRFALFMLLMVPAAGTIGAKEAARLDYVTDAFGSALGIGSVGAVIAVGTAIAGSVAGPLCDRINPRGVLLLSFAMIAASNLVTVALLIQGALATGLIEVLAFWYGLAFGIGVPALLKLQAALVPLDARGSAEIINILRLSVGGIIGVFLARISPSPEVTLAACAATLAVVGVGVAVLTRPVRPAVSASPAAGQSGAGFAGLRRVLREMPVLRSIVIADLVITFVVPTQLSNVVLVDEGNESLVLLVLLGGVVGVMVGRLSLVVTGSLGPVRRQLVGVFTAYAVVCVASVLVVAAGWLLASGLVAGAFVLLGSATSSYCLGLLAALVQQTVPDHVRGALSGLMAAARSLLIALAASVITLIVLPFSAMAVLMVLSVLTIGSLLVLRGFRGITADPVNELWAGPEGPAHSS